MNLFFKRVRYYWRLLSAIVLKYFWAVALGIFGSLFIFILVPKLIGYLPKYRKTINLGVVGRYTQANIPDFIQHQLSFGLTSVTADKQLTPKVAKAWTLKDGGKTIEFSLDTNLTWHDGEKLTSKDINYNFKDVTLDYPTSDMLVIKLKEPFAPIFTAVSTPIFKKGLLGLGDYKIGSFTKNGQYYQRLTLVPVDQASDKPNIIYRFYISEEAAITAFKLGEIFKIENLSTAPKLDKWPNSQVIVKHQDQAFVGIFLNTKALDKNTRLGLYYAINKSRWDNRVFSPISHMSWYYNPDVKKYDYDFDKAKALIKTAGKIPNPFILATTPELLAVAEDIKRDWEKLGIKINIWAVSELPTDFHGLLAFQPIPTDPDQYMFWHSTHVGNISKLDNKRIDKILEDGRTNYDFEVRKKLYFDLQKYLLEEVPAIFLYTPVSYTLTKP